MSSLADLPELVGFFSYSREDDEDSHGALSALRTRIQGELRGQLGRTAKTFRLWQDKEAIASGTLWETEIRNAVAQAVFFIPIITPTVIASPYCRFELESFLGREAELGRGDLVFPILYIEVPALEDATRRQNDPIISLIAKRQYVDWSEFRYLDVDSTEVRRAVGRFCADIRNSLYRPWISPEERNQQEEEAAVRAKEEAERQRREAEAKRLAEEEEARQRMAEEERRQREAEAERKRVESERQKAERERQEAEAKRRAEEEEARQKREAEAEQARIAALEANAREEAEAKRRAEEEKAQQKTEEERQEREAEERRQRPLSRPLLVAASLLGLIVLGAIGAWLVLSPTLTGPTALSATQEQALKPKDTFQECSKCPVMMVVPAGNFFMGSPASEPGRDRDEGPQHVVTIAAQFAVGQHELTFDQWDACVADGGCNAYKPSDEGWEGGRHPVINVSWDDANAYVTWLAKKTGKPYRLLSEAEYEYASRAGSMTAYPWGDAIGKNNANCNGCGSQWDNKQTAPVGSFAANGFGLYDMVGNVWEWTQDCYHDSYDGAPMDGSAWSKGDCSRRVLRGGSWDTYPRFIRSADRDGLNTDLRNSDFGFRVGRTLVTP
jgi:formylglycine-generating enzyme required for sulfatase activity